MLIIRCSFFVNIMNIFSDKKMCFVSSLFKKKNKVHPFTFSRNTCQQPLVIFENRDYISNDTSL